MRMSFRQKVIGNSLIVLLIVAVASLYTGLATSELARSVKILFRNTTRVRTIGDLLSRTEAALGAYLTTKSSDSLKDYIMYSTRLGDSARGLDRRIVADESVLFQRDLGSLLETYLADAERAVAAKRGRDVAGYAEGFGSSETDAEYARTILSKLDDIYLSDSLAAFSGFDSAIPSVLATNASLVIAATLLGIAVLVRLTYKITDPLQKLAEAARAVGRGEYGGAPLPVDSGDEIGTTAAAFMAMRESVGRAFSELRSKAEIEKKLMEERMLVLDMGHRLKDAELLALQSQINPHFLFNTLSAGIQLALVERADRTGEFLERLAAFIRYSLRSPSRSVRVAEEIECVGQYIWLLRLRFGDRYSFSIESEAAALEAETPALILQPLVENSIAHGLRGREEGGRVLVSARVSEGGVVLCVEDSGQGMTEEAIAAMYAEESSVDMLEEGGIGLRNVMKRVSLATNGRGRVELLSAIGRGTTVRILLPGGAVS